MIIYLLLEQTVLLNRGFYILGRGTRLWAYTPRSLPKHFGLSFKSSLSEKSQPRREGKGKERKGRNRRQLIVDEFFRTVWRFWEADLGERRREKFLFLIQSSLEVYYYSLFLASLYNPARERGGGKGELRGVGERTVEPKAFSSFQNWAERRGSRGWSSELTPVTRV